jgi:hypothetical protein
MARSLASTLRRIVVLSAVLAGVLVGVHRAEATIIEAMPLEELVSRADHVVIGTVLATDAHYDERGRIVTDVRIRVDSTMKGPAQVGSELVVRRLGGVVGDIGMRVEGEPEFDTGDRRLLFLRDRGLYCRAVGMSQGSLPLRSENGRTWVESGTTGLALVRREGVELVPASAAITEPVPLDTVLERIRALVSQSRVEEGPRRDLR